VFLFAESLSIRADDPWNRR